MISFLGSDDGKMDFVDVDDDCKSCASTSTDGHVITNSSDKENCSLLKPHRVPSPISDASLGSDDSEESSQNSSVPHPSSTELPQQNQQQSKPRIWSIVDTATSNQGPSSSNLPPGASSRLSPLQRAAYLSPYPKPASWYAGTLGNISVVTSVGGSFPLSAVYSCPPIGGASSGGAPSLAESSAVSSLNRLRTAAAAFPSAGELSIHKAAVAAAASSGSPPPSVFNLATKMSGSSMLSGSDQQQPPHQPGVSRSSSSSGSAAAIAAMTSSTASSVINSGSSQGRVIS